MSELTHREKCDWASNAKSYLKAARILVDKVGSKPLYRKPILHLICHAIELALKLNLRQQGILEKNLINIGHDLDKLWNHSKSGSFKVQIYSIASAAWENAKNSGNYIDGEFDENPSDVLNEYIQTLSYLHTNKSGFALRYPVEKDEEGPIPLLLLDTFDQAIKVFVDQIKLSK